MSVEKISHPTTDAKLPSFVHPILADVEKQLELVEDCWELLIDDKRKYIPKEPREPKTAYDARLMRASYPSFFRDAIIAFAGVLSRYELRDAPPLFEQYSSNIDGEGNSLKAFGMAADARVLRDGGCLITVDMPPGRPGDRVAERQMGRRPKLAMVEREYVLNWRTEKVGGIERCTACTILEWHETEDGDYGVKLEPRYRVMRDGLWRVLRMVQNRAEWTLETATDEQGEPMEGVYEDASGRPLDYPPVIWYGSTREGFGRGQLPLYTLATLTLDWLREYSDLKELLHKTAMPIPVRTGMVGAGPNGSTPTLVLGPNSGLDLPTGGTFAFAEVSGSSLDKHEEHLKHIEGLIDRQTLSFLFSGGGDKTATQSLLESAQLQATLTSLGEAKSSVMESAMELWCLFTGETSRPGAGISLLPGVFDKPVDSVMLTVATQLYNSSLLSRETMVRLQAKAGLLPPGRTPEDEVAAILEEEAMQAADVPDMNSDELTGA